MAHPKTKNDNFTFYISIIIWKKVLNTEYSFDMLETLTIIYKDFIEVPTKWEVKRGEFFNQILPTQRSTKIKP